MLGGPLLRTQQSSALNDKAAANDQVQPGKGEDAVNGRQSEPSGLMRFLPGLPTPITGLWKVRHLLHRSVLVLLLFTHACKHAVWRTG